MKIEPLGRKVYESLSTSHKDLLDKYYVREQKALWIRWKLKENIEIDAKDKEILEKAMESLQIKRKKGADCFQNLFIYPDKNFIFLRLYAQKIKDINELFNCLAQFNIDIKYGNICTIEENTEAVKIAIHFTLDNLDTLKKIKEQISGLEDVEWISEDPDKDLIFLGKDFGFNKEFPILAFDNNDVPANRVIIAGGLWARIVEMANELGAVEPLLMKVGEKQGISMAGRTRKIMEAREIEDIDIEMIINLFNGYGYSLIDKIEMNNKTINKIIVSDSFFIMNNLNCNFLIGLFGSYFTELTGEKHHFSEKKCIGKGADFCEFVNAS